MGSVGFAACAMLPKLPGDPLPSGFHPRVEFGGGEAQPTVRENVAMKADIHPDYIECAVTCGCGNSFATRATVPELKVEICSACHPFYTGKQKFVDAAGRVEKFQKRFQWKEDSIGGVLSDAEKQRESQRAALVDQEAKKRQKLTDKKKKTDERRAKILEEKKAKYAEQEAAKKAEEEAKAAAAAESAAPAADAPKAEAPKADAPKADAPKAEKPDAEAPAAAEEKPADDA